MTLTATAGLAAISVAVRYAEPAGSPAFGAGSFDRFFRDALRSRSKTDNFLDGGLGDMYLPLIGTGLLLGASAADQGIDGYRDAVTRAVPLLWFGIGGNDLFVTSAKKAFGRKRPYLRFENERAIREFGTGDDARESFYSGHATTGFFAAAFTDRVLADVLQKRHPDYCLSCGASWTQRLLRAGQAALLYGLASYVGYSRIEIDKHYMTDVLAGAAIGALNGQLTYVWGYRPESERRRAVEPVVGPGSVALRWEF